MNGLIVSLMIWISTATGLPPPDNLPAVVFASQEQILEIAGIEESAIRIIALYNTEFDAIVLNESWDKTSTKDVSSLLHELVHYMADVAQVHYQCRGASEKVAYEAQKAYLEEHGKDLFTEFNMDRLFLRIVTSCPSGPFS